MAALAPVLEMVSNERPWKRSFSFLKSSSFVAASNSLMTPPPCRKSLSQLKYLTWARKIKRQRALFGVLSGGKGQTKATPSRMCDWRKPSSSTSFLTALASVTGDLTRSMLLWELSEKFTRQESVRACRGEGRGRGDREREDQTDDSQTLSDLQTRLESAEDLLLPVSKLHEGPRTDEEGDQRGPSNASSSLAHLSSR